MSDLQTTKGAIRATGQRWMRWRNESSIPCPPWGWLIVTGAFIDGTEIVFHGTRNSPDPTIPPVSWFPSQSENGVPWTAGFNSHEAVSPGDTGRFTVDLPTWCLIDPHTNVADSISNDAGLMGFYTYQPDSDPWVLRRKLVGPVNPSAADLWPGYRVIAELVISEFTDIWRTKLGPATFAHTDFRIGMIGGLVTELSSSTPDTGETIEL